MRCHVLLWHTPCRADVFPCPDNPLRRGLSAPYISAVPLGVRLGEAPPWPSLLLIPQHEARRCSLHVQQGLGPTDAAQAGPSGAQVGSPSEEAPTVG